MKPAEACLDLTARICQTHLRLAEPTVLYFCVVACAHTDICDSRLESDKWTLRHHWQRARSDEPLLELEWNRWGKTQLLKIRVGRVQDVVPFAEDNGGNRQNSRALLRHPHLSNPPS